MLCYVMSCHVMSCHVMSCYVISLYRIFVFIWICLFNDDFTSVLYIIFNYNYFNTFNLFILIMHMHMCVYGFLPEIKSILFLFYPSNEKAVCT